MTSEWVCVYDNAMDHYRVMRMEAVVTAAWSVSFEGRMSDVMIVSMPASRFRAENTAAFLNGVRAEQRKSEAKESA